MRVLALRVLISWWMIPVMAIPIIGLGYLLTGDLKESVQEYKDFAHSFWYGDM